MYVRSFMYIYIYIYNIYIYILELLPNSIPRTENLNPKKSVNIQIYPSTEIYFSPKKTTI